MNFSTGLKLVPWAHTAVFVNSLLPLNDDGLRADWIFAVGVEAVL